MRGGHENYPDQATKTTNEAGRLPYISEKGAIVMYPRQWTSVRKKRHIPLLKACFIGKICFKDHISGNRKAPVSLLPDPAATPKKDIFYI